MTEWDQNRDPNILPSSFIMLVRPRVSRLSDSLKVNTNTFTAWMSSFKKSTSCSMLFVETVQLQ